MNVAKLVQLVDEAGDPVDAANPLPTTATLAAETVVQLADENGDPIEAANPLPVTLAAGTETVGNTKDAGPAQTTTFGLGAPPARFASADQSASAAAVTNAPTAGQKLVIADIVVSVAAAMTVTFTEETTGTVKLVLYMPANGTAQVTPRSKCKLDTADKKLMVQTSVAGNIAVSVGYYSEA